ncbi:hypothetical protein CS537_17175 [Yersinia mollaretii]|nr:hypothetical protein CS537_17175 [Yersinia mollaretii]
MYNLTVQNEALTLAGYLSKVDIENACNLSKPDIESAIARSSTHINEGFIGVTTRGGLSFATSTRDEFSDSIKKSSTANATLWPYVEKVQSFGFLRWRSLISLCATSTMALIFPPAFVPISSIRASASSALLRLDSNLFSSLSLSWRRAISPCIAVTIKPALLSPSIFTASISSSTSCGMRAVTDCDFALLEPVAINLPSVNWCITVYIKSNYTKELICKTLVFIFNYTLSTGKAQEAKITTPRTVEAVPRRLTTNVNVSNEVAMLNHTPTRFKFLFLAVCRSDLNAKPHRESVTAHSEQDARRSLAGQFVLSFAGRIPNRRVMA